MNELFQIESEVETKNGQVRKTPFNLSILRKGLFSVSVDRLPLVEYYVFFDNPIKTEQIKVKVYKTTDGVWYDKHHSEEAELYSPEFGSPKINDEIKRAIDVYESNHRREATYFQLPVNNFLL